MSFWPAPPSCTMPEVPCTLSPALRAFLHRLFLAAYLSTPLFICYRGNKVTASMKCCRLIFLSFGKTLKTSPFDAVVLLQSSKIVILQNCLAGDSVDYCVENVDAYLRALLDRISRHMWQLVKHARGQDWRYLSHSEDFDLRAQAQAELLAGKRDSPGCEVGMGGLVRRRGGNPSLFTVPAS